MLGSKFTTRVRRLAAGTLIAGLAVGGAVGASAAHAQGGKTCVGFAVDFNDKTIRGDIRKTLTDAQATGKSMFVHGTMAEFSINLDTFEVTNYTLTAATDVTDVKTLVSRTDTTSTWAVDAGGRRGAVFGEDATQ